MIISAGRRESMTDSIIKAVTSVYVSVLLYRRNTPMPLGSCIPLIFQELSARALFSRCLVRCVFLAAAVRARAVLVRRLNVLSLSLGF